MSVLIRGDRFIIFLVGVVEFSSVVTDHQSLGSSSTSLSTVLSACEFATLAAARSAWLCKYYRARPVGDLYYSPTVTKN